MLLKTLNVFFVRGFGAAAGFLVTLALAQVFNTNDAGYILLSLALVSFLGTLVTLGSPTLLIKIVGAQGNKQLHRINSGLSCLLLYSLLFGAFILVCLAVFNEPIARLFEKPPLAPLLPIIGVAIIWFAFIQLISAALQGKQVTVFASIVQNVISQLLFLLFIGYCYYFDTGLTTKLGLLLFTSCLILASLVGAIVWFKDKQTKFVFNLSLDPFLKQALIPLFTVMIMMQCVQWSGQLATGIYLSAENIAYFAAAQRTALLASFVLIAVNLVVAPKFANAFAKGNSKEVNKLSKLSSKLMLLMAMPVLLLMLIFPEFLMGLFGPEYIVAAPLLQIMAIGQFINVFTGSVGFLLNMTGHEKDFRNVVLFSGPLAILLAFLLTKEYGLHGAAYATAFSVATQNLLAVWMVKKRLGFNTLNIFRKAP
jgi:O-antigen/teichoic acid export membrane protein